MGDVGELRVTGALVFNFTAAIAVIFTNKHIFAQVAFGFPCALSVIHYVVTYGGLLLLKRFKAFSPKSDSPMTLRLWLLSVVVGIAPGLNNLSLKLNSMGFYTVAKLMVTPMIVTLEKYLEGKVISRPRVLALVALSFGVGLATINDLELSPKGCLVAFTWLPIAAFYKVFWSRTEKEDGWQTMPLMYKVLPWSTLWMIMLCPVVDPPGLAQYPWTFQGTGLIFMSGVAAFCVNYSGFLVLGICRPLTHVVLGQLKSGAAILGGAILFGQAQTPRALLGSIIAVASSGAYAAVSH